MHSCHTQNPDLSTSRNDQHHSLNLHPYNLITTGQTSQISMLPLVFIVLLAAPAQKMRTRARMRTRRLQQTRRHIPLEVQREAGFNGDDVKASI